MSRLGPINLLGQILGGSLQLEMGAHHAGADSKQVGTHAWQAQAMNLDLIPRDRPTPNPVHHRGLRRLSENSQG